MTGGEQDCQLPTWRLICQRRVVDIVQAHGIVVLEGLVAHVSTGYQRRPMLHAVGDGTFVVDGERLNRRRQMFSKLPPGV